VCEIEQLLQVALENITPEDGTAMVKLLEDEKIGFPWKEGTEELSEMSEDELWTHLGLKDTKALPFFQDYTDPDGAIHPWCEVGEKWLALESSPQEVLKPQWHQLVRILRMLKMAFQNQPVLLMDCGGIGKTFQVVGVMACLAFYHQFYEKNQKFPWIFGTCHS
jgi:hypothetical protein